MSQEQPKLSREQVQQMTKPYDDGAHWLDERVQQLADEWLDQRRVLEQIQEHQSRCPWPCPETASLIAEVLS